MHSINLQFIGLGYNDINQANIKIYNSNGCLMLNRYTYNNRLRVCLNKNRVYKLVATSSLSKIITFFYVNNYNTTYTFIFSNALISNCLQRNVIFLLTDANYTNLPIEKGEIILG